jgi:hypothetical protein
MGKSIVVDLGCELPSRLVNDNTLTVGVIVVIPCD